MAIRDCRSCRGTGKVNTANGLCQICGGRGYVLMTPRNDESVPKSDVRGKRVPQAELMRPARLRAAESVLEIADREVAELDHQVRITRQADLRREFAAQLDIWKRVQKIATNDIRKYGGAVEEPAALPVGVTL